MSTKNAKALKVLFIGNSFTARNDVPGLIGALAAVRGVEVQHRLISRGGASLGMHWNKGEAPGAIRGGGWDYVVLQEQSTLPVKNAARMHQSVRLFDGAVREGGAGASLALYMTWARRHAPESQGVITEAYRSIGRELGAVVVPVGEAWERLLRREGGAPVDLYDKDGSHPSLAGSYLAACVFYGVLFADSPAGIGAEVKGLSAADAAALRDAAAAVLE